MRTVLILLAILLIPLKVSAVIVGYSHSGGGTPPEPSIIAEAVTRTSNNARLLNEWTIGNSFTVSATANFYSLSLLLEGASNPSGTITCRIDDDSDMQTEYVEEFSLSFAGSSEEEWIEILSVSNPQLTSGTWYVACNSSSAINIAIEDSSIYSGGLYIYRTYPNWNTFSTLDTRETLFKIKAQ